MFRVPLPRSPGPKGRPLEGQGEEAAQWALCLQGGGGLGPRPVQAGPAQAHSWDKAVGRFLQRDPGGGGEAGCLAGMNGLIAGTQAAQDQPWTRCGPAS